MLALATFVSFNSVSAEVALAALPSAIRARVKSASCAELCNDSAYDADLSARVPEVLGSMLDKQAFYVRDALLESSADPEPESVPLDTDDSKVLNNDVVKKLAEAYISYQLSAVDAAVNGRRGVKKLDAEALASASNLKPIRK